jgi:hypothetical protein
VADVVEINNNQEESKEGCKLHIVTQTVPCTGILHNTEIKDPAKAVEHVEHMGT